MNMYKLLFLSLLILFVILVGMVDSAVCQIFRTDLDLYENVQGRFEFYSSKAGIDIFALDINGFAKCVRKNSENKFVVDDIGKVKAGTPVAIYYIADDIISGADVRFSVKHGDRIRQYHSSGVLLDVGPLQDVTDTLSFGTAGVQDTHRVGFNIVSDSLKEKSEIWIAFNGNFYALDIDVNTVAYSDDDANNDGNEPTVDTINVIDQTLIVKLDDGSPAAANSRINVSFYPVKNDTVAGDYIVTVMVVDSTGVIVYSPTASSLFTIIPDSLDNIQVAPSADLNVPSDSIVVFTAAGYDQYNNVISGLTYNWNITVDSCGSVNDGIFQANKLGECHITATSSSMIDSSGLITVTNGPFNQFGFTGYPSQIDAGNNFPPCTVTVYDVNNNIIYDFSDSIYFFSSDDTAYIAYDENNLYHFTAEDSGQHQFDSGDFILRRSGSQTISVTNGNDTTTSCIIIVTPASIDTFEFQNVGNQNAGVPFTLTIENAADEFGNPVSGNVLISAYSGGGNSPGGVPPIFTNIMINNGTGSAMQTMTSAVPTVLKGVISDLTVYTNSFDVSPGVAGNLELTNYPDTIIVGNTFPTDPTVTVTDLYGNISTNYTGTVEFSGADSLPAPYEFQPVDTGIIAFDGTSFMFDSTGSRRLIITDQNDSSLTDTSSIIQVYAAGINTFAVAVDDTVTAGSAFNLTVSAAVDTFGNPASGTVTVDASYGGGDSPGGVPPSFNDIIVIDGSGQASQILTLADSTVLRCIAGSDTVYTDTITVLPGSAEVLSLTNYPNTITVGETFPLDPNVTVTDLYGNIKIDYTDTVAFSGADSVHAPYQFDLADAGSHDFPGTAFMFETAGSRNLIAFDQDDADLVDTSSVIQVYAAGINTFAVAVDDTVTAGSAFNLTVSAAIDTFGNPASGTVIVDASYGGGDSPGGVPPSFNDIIVIDGSGQASQILTLADSTVLRCIAGSDTVYTDTITVLPGDQLGGLEMVIASPLVSGNPFGTVSTITAKDNLGNIKTNFDAAVDSIVIGSSTGGPINPDVLRQTSDFVDGIADLNSLNVTYSGQGGQVVFNATSQSGVYGESNAVNVISLYAENLNLDINEVACEDTARGTVSFTNFGNVTVEIVDINIFDENSDLIISAVFPSMPDSILGGSDTTTSFWFIVPTNSDPGRYPLSMWISGSYSGLMMYDTLDVFSDTLIVVTESHLVYVDNSLLPTTVSTGYEYSFSISVHNDGGSAVSLNNDSTYIYFTDGSSDYRADLIQSSVIEPDSLGLLNFEQVEISSSFDGGSYPVKFYIYGSDLGGVVYDSLDLSDSVLVQTAFSVSYEPGSLSPDTILTGDEAQFSVRVFKSGQASLQLNHNLTRISFSDGTNQFVALSDTASEVRIDTISTDTTLTFTSTTLPTGFISGNYQPVIHISGMQNQQEYSIDLNTDSVSVLSPGRVRIDSLFTVSMNSPRVNVNQQFTIHGFISNLGDEPVDSVTLLLDSDADSSSTFAETLYIGTIDNLSGTVFDYDIIAASTANPSEIFQCFVIRAINRISGDSAVIVTPLDNSTSAIIEDSASFWIDTLYLSDDSISTGQEFSVYAVVMHFGSDSYTGSGQVALDFEGDSDFQVVDSLRRNFISNQLLSWAVTAPDSSRDSALVRVSFVGPFIDLNDSTSALMADSIVTAVVTVTDSASITHQASITSPSGATDGILSTGQSFTVTDSLFPAGNAGESFARVVLPDGFSSVDPLVQPLSGQTVDWRVIAGDNVTVDSLYFDCWCFDSNTGDSVYDAPIWIPVEIVERATLSLSLNITAPPSAIDRIVTPGGYFTLEAVVTNAGDAETNDGELTLLLEDGGFAVEEPAVRIFTPGTPVQWHITAPDTQILSGIPITTLINTIPLDLNTGESANVINDSAGIEVILRDELPELVLQNPESQGGVAVCSQPVDVYGFTLANSSEIADVQIALISLSYRLMSGDNSIAPDEIVSASVLRIDDQPFEGVIGDSLVSFNFEQASLSVPIIEPDSSAEIIINITLTSAPAVNSFRINLGSEDIVARAVIGGIYDQFVEIVLPDGEEFTLETVPFAVMQTEFISSVVINNNPYLAAEGNLEIGYNLNDDAVIDVAIFSIDGEKAWDYQATPSNGGGLTGPHYDNNAVLWNGRNLSDNSVLSGVYYIFVTNNSSGQTAKIKAAVIW